MSTLNARFSTAKECENAVKFIKKDPSALLLVLVFNRETSDSCSALTAKLTEELSDSRGNGNICMLAVRETQIHAQQFLQMFKIDSTPIVALVRYDGVLIDTIPLPKISGLNRVVDMVIKAQINMKSDLVDFLSSFVIEHHEKILSKLHKVKENKDGTDVEKATTKPNTMVKTLSKGPKIATPISFSADEWVEKVASSNSRPEAVLRAKELLKCSMVGKPKRDVSTVASTKTSVRVGIRLMDGRKLLRAYKPEDKLYVVRDFAQSEIGSLSPDKWILATAYPRVCFDEEDMNRTLAELNISSNALLVVEPKEGYSDKTTGKFEGFFAYFLTWVFSIWDVVFARFFAKPIEVEAVSIGAGDAETTASLGTAAGNIVSSKMKSNFRRRVKNMNDLKERDKEEGSKSNEYFGGDSTAFLGGDDNST